MNYRVTFQKTFNLWGGNDSFTVIFYSDTTTANRAEYMAQELGGTVEVYIPSIDTWAPLDDAKVLNKYLEKLR